jgi:hypothetical protein
LTLFLFSAWLPGVLIFLLVPPFVYFFHGIDPFVGESCFPPRLLRLPVPTSSLVAWPMVYGTLSVILVWFVSAGFIWRPLAEERGLEVPLWWPALFLAAMLAWLQALLWTPFGLRGLRFIMLLTLFSLLIAADVFYYSDVIPYSGAIPFAWIVDNVRSSTRVEISEPLLVALYAGLTLIGWTAGYVGVVHARCGRVSDWQAILEPMRKLDRWLWLSRSPKPFASPARAQVWFEWRRIGRAQVFWMGLLFALTLAWAWGGFIPVVRTPLTPLYALAIPVFLAGLFPEMPWTNKNSTAPMSCADTAPMSCADRVAAKLKTAAWATLSIWTAFVAMLLLAGLLAGKLDGVADGWRQIERTYTPGAIAAGIIAFPAWLLIWTWKRRVDCLYFSLTGWIILCELFLAGCFAGFMLTHDMLTYDPPEIHESLLGLLPSVLTVLILARLLLAGWALREVLRRGLVQSRTVGRWLAVWLLTASALFILLSLAVRTEHMPVYYVAFAVLVAMPMVRLTAAPLALAWNRHR